MSRGWFHVPQLKVNCLSFPRTLCHISDFLQSRRMFLVSLGNGKQTKQTRKYSLRLWQAKNTKWEVEEMSWGYNSVKEHMPTICKALGSSPTAGNKNTGRWWALSIFIFFFLLTIFRPGFTYKDKKLSGSTVLKEAQVGDKGAGFTKSPTNVIKLWCLATFQKTVFWDLGTIKPSLPLGYEVPVCENYSIKEKSKNINIFSAALVIFIKTKLC